MFNIIDGNVFDADVDVIVHGANCFVTMGSGVARIINNEYHGAYKADQMTVKGDRRKLGTYTHWTGNHSRIKNKQITIINAYSQYEYGKGIMHADYKAILEVLLKIHNDLPNGTRIGLPFIGAGLAGGDPLIILNIFKEVFAKSDKIDATLFLIPGEFPTIHRT